MSDIKKAIDAKIDEFKNFEALKTPLFHTMGQLPQPEMKKRLADFFKEVQTINPISLILVRCAILYR
ncbi:MAG: hypothetical protein GKR87_15155 [Kiritimatiellae bacterium]|nr:hypothetical protein [Kiritimatiellia bacterium]